MKCLEVIDTQNTSLPTLSPTDWVRLSANRSDILCRVRYENAGSDVNKNAGYEVSRNIVYINQSQQPSPGL
jgi:hypothetical protein